MPCISIIVPVYNVEEYLALCLSSIRNQSFRDIEIICVNDGANDASSDLLRLFAAVDSRIRIVTKQNGGLSSARNAGVNVANGDYIMFVDSDDFLERKACERVFEAFGGTQADIVTFGAKCYPESLGYPWLIDCLSPRDIVYDAFDVDIIFKEKSRPYVWRSAFSSSFIKENGLRFDESVAFGEDQIFHFVAYPLAHKTVFISDKLYDYRVFRKDSLMSTRGQSDVLKLREHLEIVDRILDDWQRRGRLSCYATVMLEWVFEFVVYDIITQEEPVRTELITKLSGIINERFSSDELMNQELGPATRDLLSAVQSVGKGSCSIGKRTVYRYYLERRGLRECLSRARSVFFGAGPFGFIKRVLRRVLPTPSSSMHQYLGELSNDILENRRTSDAILMLLAEYESKRASGSLCKIDEVIVG